MHNTNIDVNFIDKNGHINEKRLFDHLYNYRTNRREKSVLTPSAQATTPCNVANRENTVMTNILNAYNGQVFQMRCINACLELQLLYGLRITEVLRIRAIDILKNCQIRVHGSKGSENRIVTPVKYIDFFRECKDVPVNPFSDVNRFYVYREYKKYGINLEFSNNQYNAVTHSLRYLLLKQYNNEGINLIDIQRQIGHKNIKNTKIYVNKR